MLGWGAKRSMRVFHVLLQAMDCARASKQGRSDGHPSIRLVRCSSSLQIFQPSNGAMLTVGCVWVGLQASTPENPSSSRRAIRPRRGSSATASKDITQYGPRQYATISFLPSNLESSRFNWANGTLCAPENVSEVKLVL